MKAKESEIIKSGKKIYIKQYKEPNLIELKSDKGIIVKDFVKLKKELKKKYKDVEIRVI